MAEASPGPVDGLCGNFLLLTYDSCRYDVLVDAKTPVLDSYCEIHSAQSPACYTYPAHHSFFAGILPNTNDTLPHYNRFIEQLWGLKKVGAVKEANRAKYLVESRFSVIRAARDAGYQTVGAGAMNWFRQKSLTRDFEDFKFTGRDADAQIDFLLEAIDPALPFFGFINFGETHALFDYAGKKERCPIPAAARDIQWPPREIGPIGKDLPAYWHQVEAAEFLDSRLPRLFDALPGDTMVVLCADHGECFGEDGYWGHGVNHPKVFEVPMSIFRLDRQPIVPKYAEQPGGAHAA